MIKLQRQVDGSDRNPTIRDIARHRLTLQRRKYPQFEQSEIFSLQDAFRKLDVDDKGSLDEATVIKATQQSERKPYDVVRQALKEVELDSSRRVELEDYVDVSMPLSLCSFGRPSVLWSLRQIPTAYF